MTETRVTNLAKKLIKKLKLKRLLIELINAESFYDHIIYKIATLKKSILYLKTRWVNQIFTHFYYKMTN